MYFFQKEILKLLKNHPYFNFNDFNLSFIFVDLKPVLVVGAGLSAADAVTICRSSGINVIHVYRNRSAGLDKKLPQTVYPEYHEVNLEVITSLSLYW